MAISPYLADIPPRHYLLEWREKRGLSQAKLGKMVGTTGPSISRYEDGLRGMKVVKMQFKLFEALDILPGQFYAPPEAPCLDAFAVGLSPKRRRELLEMVIQFVSEKGRPQP